jgi:hypothetical protein
VFDCIKILYVEIRLGMAKKMHVLSSKAHLLSNTPDLLSSNAGAR